MTRRQNIGWLILAGKFLVALVVYLVIMLATDPINFPGGVTLTWEILWSWFALIYIGASIRVWDPVPADKIGVRLLVGIATDSVTAGPPVVPPFLCTIELFPTATDQREFPDEPEKIFRSTEDGDQNPPAGMKPPLRINFSDSLPEDQLDTVLGKMSTFPEEGGLRWAWRPGATTAAERMALRQNSTFNPATDTRVIRFNPIVPDDGLSQSRITAEVAHISRLRVFDAVTLVKAVPPNKETGLRLDEVFRQIEDEQIIALNSILTKISLGQAQGNIDWLNAILFARVEARIGAVDGHSDSWGIDLESAAIKPFGLNRSLNKAMTGVGTARFAQTITIVQAEGERKRKILEGQGAAMAARDLEQKVLEGRGKGLAAAAKATGLTPQELLAAEVAEKIGAGDGNVIIGESGLAQLAAAGTAIAGGLAKKTKP